MKPGTAVIVNGSVVAWFREFDESAHDWCTRNFFGEWLTWDAHKPEVIPLSKAQMAKIRRAAKKLAANIRERPDA